MLVTLSPAPIAHGADPMTARRGAPLVVRRRSEVCSAVGRHSVEVDPASGRHDDQPVRTAQVGQVVRGHDDRSARIGEGSQRVDEGGRGDRIESGCWFVEEADVRLDHQFGGDRYALALPTTERPNGEAPTIGESERVQRAVDGSIDLGPGRTRWQAESSGVVHGRLDRQVAVHDVVLGDVAKWYGLLADGDPSGCRRAEARKGLEERRFARSGCTHDREELTGADVDVHGVEHAGAVVQIDRRVDRRHQRS